jgi:hypothetical protein
MPLLPHRDQLTEPLPANRDFPLCGFASLLRKGVKHVHGFIERCDVEDAMSPVNVDSNLPDTGPDGRHRLPVVRIEALLNAAQLKSSQPPSHCRKPAHVNSGRAEPQ